MPETLKYFARIWGAAIELDSKILGYGILKKIGGRASKTYDKLRTPVGTSLVETLDTTHTLCFVPSGAKLPQNNDKLLINGRTYKVLQTEPVYEKDLIFYHQIALFYIEASEEL
jgi:hypothetical protein